KQEWDKVYVMLDKDKARVDFIDKHINKGWVLLQYAYEQRHRQAIIKLVDDYSASFDELYSSDKILHDCILDFYEQSKDLQESQSLSLLQQEANLIESLSKLMVHEDEELHALPVLQKVTHSLRPIGYERALKSALAIKTQVSADAQYETGLHLLHNDFPEQPRVLLQHCDLTQVRA
ncbi:MAG TPA: hypothetical protein PLD88_10545, partial [Candidatus Berkiella sp.]|nr:hypothetical protein [Candidatus Berkiella sp.]